jgi:hypothetical protein
MSEITTLRELRPAPPPAELEAMRLAARERFVSGSRSGRARQRGRVPVLVGGLTVTAAASAAAAMVLTSGPSAVPAPHGTAGHTGTVVTAAWTVREDANGTVTIDLRQYANPAALQQTLRADGINAIVRQIPSEPEKFGNRTRAVPTCYYSRADAAPLPVQAAVVGLGALTLPMHFVIHPTAMPRGSALFLQFLTGFTPSRKNSGTGMAALKPFVLNNAAVPACVPRTALPATNP